MHRSSSFYVRSVGRPGGSTCLSGRQALRVLRVCHVFLALVAGSAVHAQGPDLVGYWHNWNDGNAPYLELAQVDPRYSVVEVSFAVPAVGSTYDMVFAPAETAPATFLAD
ncbi:MAG TPA: hypothetical protein PLA11_16085, partial [Flavobacteriales bacterium]|nr:hypothetical protein [Flavobacteriales bacterium]